MAAQTLGVPNLAQVLRRRVRLLATAAVLGAALGGVFAAIRPPTLTSSTLILLPSPIESQMYGESDIATQTKIVLSTTVLGVAAASVDPSLTTGTVEGHLDVTAETTQLLQITASSTSQGRAQALSQAVADAYLSYVNGNAQVSGDTALASLRSREDALQKQLAALTQEINLSTTRQQAVPPLSTEAKQEAQVIAQLQAERADLVIQLDRVKESLATSPTGFNSGALIVQQASPELAPPLGSRLTLWAPLGAGLFLATAGTIAMVVDRRLRRLRLRDEMAVAVGSPVLGSVRTRQRRSTVEWTTLLASYSAGPAEDWAWRRALSKLNGSVAHPGGLTHPPSIVLICLAGDTHGIALAPQLGAYAAERGTTTRLTIASGQPAVIPLWTVLSSEDRGALRTGLLLGPQRPDDPEPDLSLSMVLVDRTKPQLNDLPESEATVLMVSSGVATEEDMVRLNLALDAAGRRFDGVIVANPDSSDQTTGQRPVAVDDEVTRLPIRVTGANVLRRSSR